MIGLLIQLLILGLVIGIVWWALDWFPVPEPFNKLIKLVAIVIFAIYLIYLLLGIGHIDVPKLP